MAEKTVLCPSCASPRIHSRGTFTGSRGVRRKYACQACGRRFSGATGAWDCGGRLTPEKIEYLRLTLGWSVRATAKVFGMHRTTVVKWRRKLAAHVAPAAPVAVDATQEVCSG